MFIAMFTLKKLISFQTLCSRVYQKTYNFLHNLVFKWNISFHISHNNFWVLYAMHSGTFFQQLWKGKSNKYFAHSNQSAHTTKTTCFHRIFCIYIYIYTYIYMNSMKPIGLGTTHFPKTCSNSKTCVSEKWHRGSS